MILTQYRLQRLREQMQEEARVLEAVSAHLRDLHRSIRAPDLGDLHAMETGEVPLSLEAVWISELSEHSFLTEESADRVRGICSSRATLRRDWYPGKRPDAKVIAHLRAGLRGRTLPEDFRPPFGTLDTARLLREQAYLSRIGAGLVTDLLVMGYRWGG